MGDYFFGDWLKEQRERFKLTQKDLSVKTKGKISQSVISMWEKRVVEIPSLNNVLEIIKALDISINSVPFNHFKITGNKESVTYFQRGDILTERFSLYDLPSKANSVKTFCGKTYEVKGFVGVETKTGEVKHITDLYYDVRSVVDDSSLLTAKRKNKDDELRKVKKKKRIKES